MEPVSARKLWSPFTWTTVRVALAGGNTERVPRALHDEHGHGHRLELRQPIGSRGGTPRRLQREREAQHTHGADRLGRPAGDARSRRATAGDERQTRERARAKLLDDLDPGSVELVRRCRRASTGDAVGLLDERDGEARRERRSRCGDEIRRSDAAACPVAQDEPARGTSWCMQVHCRHPVRGRDLNPSRRDARHDRSPRRAYERHQARRYTQTTLVLE